MIIYSHDFRASLQVDDGKNTDDRTCLSTCSKVSMLYHNVCNEINYLHFLINVSKTQC